MNKITFKPKMASVCIVDDPDKIGLLADLVREEILRSLSNRPMTETQLSKQLGLTKAAVGYHLHLLMEAGLIHIEKVEAEEHGILQKYYSPTAALFIVDPACIPKDIQKYFIRAEMERLIGMFGVFQLYGHASKVSPKTLRRLAEALLKQLRDVGQKYVKVETTENVTSLRVKIYAEALARLTKQEEWHSLFPKVIVL